MITSVSLQYAKALFDLGNEKHLENEYYDYLQMVCNILNENKDIWKVLSHPLINLEEISDILDSYEYYLNASNNICNAIVYSKYQMLEEEKMALQKALEGHLNKKINLKYQLDVNLLGGMIVNIDGKVIDASTVNQIINLKNELKKGW